ncbi:MAG: hypothetical protein AB7P12_12095 [Alphaproteobacteria bacterium]
MGDLVERMLVVAEQACLPPVAAIGQVSPDPSGEERSRVDPMILGPDQRGGVVDVVDA